MPFEMVPKQTIDVENANRLLDIYKNYNEVIRVLQNFIYESENSRTLSEKFLVELVDIRDGLINDDNRLWNFVNNYIDAKGIRNVVYKERGCNNDI